MTDRLAELNRNLLDMSRRDIDALAKLKRRRLPAWLCQQLHSGLPTPLATLVQLCGVTIEMIEAAIVELARRDVLIRRNFNGIWIDRGSWDAAQEIARRHKAWAILDAPPSEA